MEKVILGNPFATDSAEGVAPNANRLAAPSRADVPVTLGVPFTAEAAEEPTPNAQSTIQPPET